MSRSDEDLDRVYARMDDDGGPVPAGRDHLKPAHAGFPYAGETVAPVYQFHAASRPLPNLPDAERALRAVGVKYDTDKAPVRQGVLEYFPRALIEIAKVSAVGARKYAWGNWKKGIPDGINRVGNAEVRHILGAVLDKGGIDVETGLLHAAQEAWNCLARLEMLLEERENGKGNS